MSNAYRVQRAFERFDESTKTVRRYPRGSIILPKEAAKIKSLPTLEVAGNIYLLPEELAKELAKRPEGVSDGKIP